MQTSLNAGERQRLLAERAAALASYDTQMEHAAALPPGSAAQTAALAAAEPHLAAAQRAEAEYYARLPRVAIGLCPFDGVPLVRAVDPFGRDGPWWSAPALAAELPPCPHFCLLRAVVADAGSVAVPCVIPRILDLPGVVAVFTRLEPAPAGAVCATAYYAERRPPVQTLAADWPRRVFLYTTALGRHHWRDDDEASDFDAAPWIARGKALWSDPAALAAACAT